MNMLRRIHLLLGCLFAPLLLYYCLSGASQALGLTYKWKDGKNQAVILSEFSRPHKTMIMPGASGSDSKKPRVDNRSESYKYFAVAMSLGISATLILGIAMAYRFFQPRWVVTAILIAGLLVPILMLWSSVKEWHWQEADVEKKKEAGQNNAAQPEASGRI